MVIFVSALIAVLALSMLGGALYVVFEKKQQIKAITAELDRYKQHRGEADEVLKNRDGIIAEAIQEAEQVREIRDTLQNACAELRQTQSELRQDVRELQEVRDGYELNFYESHFNWEKALEYERALLKNRKAQTALAKSGGAIIIEDDAEKKIASILAKLLLRAYNSECDLLMQNVDYKNVVVYENRLEKSFEQLNKLVLKYDVMISKEFFELKLEELRIYHEFQEKKQAEAEEQRQIKEIMREEMRAEREMEKAKAEAEKEEQKYQTLLDRMMEASRDAHGVELDKMNAQIAVLRQQLEDAQEKERAISQAQLTKAGHVYVISNIGSFGENVFKIGMTRRLEPMDRVIELGDASVPFRFDVHAMIHHENAPELENLLHRAFEKNRLNRINYRKEFFRVSLEEIEQVALSYKADVTFTKIAEAEEYRKSIAREQHERESA